MKKAAQTVLIVFIAFVLVYLQLNILKNITAGGYVKDQKPVAAGVFELEKELMERDKPLLLNGEWEFYPGEYLYPEDFKKMKDEDKNYINVPGAWNGYKTENGKLTAYGYATYRLVLKTRGDDIKLAMRGLAVSMEAYRVYVDGKEVLSAGSPGTGRKNTVSERKVSQAVTDVHDGTEIIIHTCNFNFYLGGFLSPLQIGSEKAIHSLQLFNISKDSFALGIFVILTLYYFFVWLKNRKNDRVILYFISISLIAIMYTVTNNEVLLKHIVPGIPFGLFNTVAYMLIIWGGTLYILFLNELFPEESNRSIGFVVTAKAVIITLVNVFLPFYIMGSFNNYYNMIVLMEFLYGLYIVAKAIQNRREGSVVILLGTTFLLATIVYDILYLASVKVSVYGGVSQAGIAVFILCFAVIVAGRLAKSFEETKKLTIKLMEMDKIKDEFLTNTSHELRTPINVITAVTESVIMGAEGKIDQRQNEALSLVVSSSRRLASLINDILDYSKLKYGNLQLIKSHFSINKLLTGIVKEFAVITDGKNITVKTEINTVLPYVYADKYRITQVLYNLLGNAAKFTAKGGEITVSADTAGDTVYISVKDTGIGIPGDKLEDIFKSFEQADASITRKYGGMGLGLSISKQIVQAHGKEIRVESRLGKGTVFTFGIPVSTKVTAAEEDKISNIACANIEITVKDRLHIKGEKSDTVIIIDDNYSNIFGTASVLKTQGYTIKGFTRAEEGLAEINENKHAAVVILDIMMPEISGYEACRRIRERYSLFELPILVMTARTQTESLLESFRAGANDFLCKPFDAEELKARVDTLYNLKIITEKAINNEIAFLQAQINPHFLYNAMNTVAACCYEDNESASELIINLADYFRYSFDFDGSTKEIPLEREIELVKVYLSIEKARFEERLEYEIDLDEIEMISIPPFTIQPLVENAVRHGLFKKEEGGKVKISGRKEGSNYNITVEDNGIGIPDGDIEKVLNGEKASGTGIGIKNVRKRLRTLYGTDLELESKYGSGTKATLRIQGGRHADSGVV